MSRKIYNLFSDDFISNYKNITPPFGPLGYIVYKRTYARKIGNRTEEWFETCKRVLNGNFSLECWFKNIEPTDEMIQEAEKCYDALFNMRWLPGGRGLWASGTKIQAKHGGSLTNCYYVDVKPYHKKVSYAFMFAMDQLMVGAGVGFGVSRRLVNKLPKVKREINLKIVCSEKHKDFGQFEVDEIHYSNQDTTTYHVDDSREGWVTALEYVIEEAFKSTKRKTRLIIDVSNVREYGQPIKGFGGVSSGPKPLVSMLRNISKILNNTVNKKLTSVQCMDMMCLIGRCVIAGNVRRSAMIAIGDADDQEFVSAKNYGESPEKDAIISHHRWVSNNSVIVNTPEDIDKVIPYLIKNGEPGIFNQKIVQNYGRLIDKKLKKGLKDPATGTNPCGEISLESFECCNLAEIFPTKCNSSEEIMEAAEFAVRYAKRVTLSYYPWIETQEVVNRSRRIGISISGITDWLSLYSDKQIKNTLSELYDHVKECEKLISEQLGVCRSIKITTVKPSGTISKLTGVSTGIHFHPSEFYIRRIQFQKDDILIKYLSRLGFTMRESSSSTNTIVVEFPIKSPMAYLGCYINEQNVTLEKQIKFQEMLQAYWADNSVSCTLKFKEHQKDSISKLLKSKFNLLKSTTLLPVSNINELKKIYKDLPEEPIQKHVYDEMISKIKGWPGEVKFNVDIGLFEGIEESDCEGGSCPVR